MPDYQPGPNVYALISAKASEIESELTNLKRWQEIPLPHEKFENMGAFGSNTMSFEQWLQFVLLPRIQEIVRNKEEFPSESTLSTYAVRAFDGDLEAGNLIQLLEDIDLLINGSTSLTFTKEIPADADSVSLGQSDIPTVVYTLAEVLPQFEDDALECQLQTFDIFLNILHPSARETISELLQMASDRTTDIRSKLRIRQAALSVSRGSKAAER